MGGYNHNNPANRMRARRLLASMMDDARKEADRGGLERGYASHIFENMEKHLSEDRLDGVHIYPAPLGGWHADISFKDMPTGFPPIIGTPKMHPCKTREEATKSAVMMIGMVLGIIRKNAGVEQPEDEQVAAFAIDEVTLYIPVGLLDGIREKLGTPDEKYVRGRLAAARAEYAGGRNIDGDAVDGLSPERRTGLQVLAAMALLVGFVRWPETVDMAPEPSVRQ